MENDFLFKEENAIDLTEVTGDFFEKEKPAENASQFNFSEVDEIERLRAAAENQTVNTGANIGGENSEQAVNINLSALSPTGTTRLLDTVQSSLTAFALRKFAGKKSRSKDWRFLSAELREIEPIVEQCLKRVNLNFDNPFIALGVSVAIMTGSKVLGAYDDLEDVEETTAETETATEWRQPNATTEKTGAKRGRPRKQA